MKVDPDAPAYPIASEHGISYYGLPIRLEIASRVLSGLRAHPAGWGSGSHDVAKWALADADALIDAHNETQKEDQ